MAKFPTQLECCTQHLDQRTHAKMMHEHKKGLHPDWWQTTTKNGSMPRKTFEQWCYYLVQVKKTGLLSQRKPPDIVHWRSRIQVIHMIVCSLVYPHTFATKWHIHADGLTKGYDFSTTTTFSHSALHRILLRGGNQMTTAWMLSFTPSLVKQKKLGASHIHSPTLIVLHITAFFEL